MKDGGEVCFGLILNPEALAKPEAVQVKPFTYDPGYGLYVYEGTAAHFCEWQVSPDGSSATLVDRMVVQGNTSKRLIRPYELVRRWIAQAWEWKRAR